MTKLLIILAMSFLITSCGSTAREEQAGLTDQEDQDIAAVQSEMREAPEEMLSSFSVSGFSKGGQKQWDLEGKSANILEEEIQLNDVTGKVYGKDANMTIIADAGSLNKIDSNVHLEKNVKATSDDGAVLLTDYLDWDAQNETLSSDAPVWLERGQMKASGKGIVGQPTLSLVELKQDVVVELNLNPQNGQSAEIDTQLSKEQAVERELEDVKGVRETSTEFFAPSTVITCDGPLEVDYQNNLAIFYNNVKVKDERGEIYSDRMDVYFATETEEGKKVEGIEGMGIDKIICTGNVEIHHGENITYSQKAVYDTLSGTLTLTGAPKLVIYSTEGFSQLMGKSEGEDEPAGDSGSGMESQGPGPELTEEQTEDQSNAFIEDEWPY